ncbi:MAG: right-handed parallel beta-helix repeat-containing protein [Armatimonadetes bacterium]|nr:right-handed parallel beta-helix repeat-containing protein [Armatimonadota bacterium]
MNPPLPAIVLVAATLILVSLRPAHSAEFFVSPTGDDASPGTQAAPFATIQRAQEAVRALKAGGLLGGPVTVFLREGTWFLDQPLAFTPEDSGSETCPITWQAFPGEQPIVSAGSPVTGWTRHDDRLWVADLPWIRDRAEPLTQLFVNGVRRTLARTPNVGEYFYSRRLTLTTAEFPECLGLTFAADDLAPWEEMDRRRVCLFHNWVNSYNRVGSADWNRKRLTFARPAGIFFLGPSVRYYVEDAFEYLDAPGEWFCDQEAGRLYYYPAEGEDMTQAEVIAPRLVQTLAAFSGEPDLGLFVEHLTFRGISFQHTDADLSADYAHSVQGADTQRGAFFGRGMRDCTIEDCEFTRLGEHAIALREACMGNVIQRCHIHDMGGGGVYLSQGVPARPDDAMLTARNTVDSNFIHDGGHIFRAGCGVFLGGSASYNAITHNEICDLSWMGVHLGWSWTGRAPAYTHHNEVGYNHIHHIGNGVLNDIGGIYTLGISTGTVLHHNLIHDITRFERGKQGYGGWGIYLDAGSSEIVVEKNVVYDTRDGGLHIHNHSHPYGDIIRNNVFAYSAEGQMMRNADHDTDHGVHADIQRNIVYNANPRMLWGSNWSAESKFTADHNCYWSEATDSPDFDGKTFAEWQATGRDEHSIIADPGFVDAAGRNFALRPDSPALTLGFQPIDMSGVGLRGPEEWRRLPLTVTHRSVEVAAPEETSGVFAEDFEDYDVNEVPDGGVAPDGETCVMVTDAEPASGMQCAVFTDAPVKDAWKPHWYASRSRDPGVVRFSCAVKLDAGLPAMLDLEFRDWDMGAGVGYETGPYIRFFADGSVKAGSGPDGPDWIPLGQFPLGNWLRVEVEFEDGPGKPKTYTARIGPWDGGLRTFTELPFQDLGFERCNWVGFAGTGNEPGKFYVDAVTVE